ncbi:FadR/GntR family transcriptional regulator [Mesorhizobium sp. LHD-90]|uniref:FadR/GntR family transcriptional regulator n=1 Tax=Mesorhizobium sp. LHD-90 TaxID=3071414 RepID=UPI0027E0A621|nr:FadR/GntR family transcriptional regulator [Mesorhizobium sp. LHD-90]MDQ6436255.1 FadR/GntR family transcriptional regulator [Mesorhizobium sp. LHD-90]
MAEDRRGRAAGTEAAAEAPVADVRADEARLRGFRISGASVHAALANEIGQRIVRGDYPPGTTLPNEQKWSQTFDVSRSAVREAIKMLMAKNLLVSRPKVGSRVEPRDRWNLLDRDVLGWYASAPDRLKFLRTVQEFRYIIEPEATALAATRRSEEQMAEITQACTEMGTARFLSERTEADTRFHVAILRASGNELLVPLGVLIESTLDNLFGFITREVNDLKYAQELHEDIEKCIRLQRPEAARKAVRRLLANTDEIIGRAASR